MSTDVYFVIMTILALSLFLVSFLSHLRYEGYLLGTHKCSSSEIKEKRMRILLYISYTTGLLFYLCLIALLLAYPTWKTLFYCGLLLCFVGVISMISNSLCSRKEKKREKFTMCVGEKCLLKHNCYRYYIYDRNYAALEKPSAMRCCPIESRPGYIPIKRKEEEDDS